MSMSAAFTTSGPLVTSRRPWARLSLRLWHRLLSAGRGDVAEFRGWERAIQWRAYTTPQERRLAVRRTVKLPLRAVREARADVQAFGSEVTAATGVSRRRQLLQLWWLKVRYGIKGRSYLAFQLYRPDRWRRAGEYVQEGEFNRVGRYMRAHLWRDAAETFWGRRRFEQLCREHAIPTVPTLVEFAEGRISETTLPDGVLPPCDLFSKPTESTGGEGAARWLYDGRGGYTGRDGRTRTSAELLEELAELSRQPGPKSDEPRSVLLKECVRNHASLLPLTPGGLCTARIETYRLPGGTPRYLLGVYKMPANDAAADNFRFGGVIAPIDEATGRLGPGVFKVGKLLTTVTDHPTTGTRIEGHQLPWWREAVDLVLRAHAVIPVIGLVGWDVALRDDGPVIIEGNSIPSAELAQEASGVPLGATPLMACLNAHLRSHMQG